MSRIDFLPVSQYSCFAMSPGCFLLLRMHAFQVNFGRRRCLGINSVNLLECAIFVPEPETEIGDEFSNLQDRFYPSQRSFFQYFIRNRKQTNRSVRSYLSGDFGIVINSAIFFS